MKCAIKQKKLNHIAFKKSNNLIDKNNYSNLRNKSRDRDYVNYINNVQYYINNNPKYFWKFFKNKRNQNTFPSNDNYNNDSAVNDQNII